MRPRREQAPRPAEYHDPKHASSKESTLRHARRYRDAVRLLRAAHLPDGAILDCACGTGYGTAILAKAFKGRCVIGVDRNHGALDVARARYRVEGVAFYGMSIHQAGAWLHGFHPLAAVVCIETLEHLAEHQQAPWLERAYNALEPGGLLVVMCPVRKGRRKPRNPWHLYEPTFEELADLMGGTGGEVTTYPPEDYISTAGERAWQATATASRI
jgi:cyclopropane fatty-acyl-phospholipid synthase-like methyltransferase